jgi:urease accessory protein
MTHTDASLGAGSGDRPRADGPALVGQERAARGWEATLEIAFVAIGGATVLLRNGQRGPLAVQRPFSPEGRDVSHVTLLHPPGGLVGGDRLSIGVEVGEGAHALLTTPAAAKHYRSAGPRAYQSQRFSVAGGGKLEWLPHETILFDGAVSELRTRVDVAAGAAFIGLDLICFGLPARNERFARGRCRQRLELWRGDRPLFIERGDFDGGAPVHGARWGLGGAPIMGTLLATPGLASDHPAVAAVRELGAALPDGDLGAVTRLDWGSDAGARTDAAGGPPPAGDPSVLCCRYLGSSAERGARYLRDAWRLLRPPLLGRPAVAPRIWAT